MERSRSLCRLGQRVPCCLPRHRCGPFRRYYGKGAAWGRVLLPGAGRLLRLPSEMKRGRPGSAGVHHSSFRRSSGGGVVGRFERIDADEVCPRSLQGTSVTDYAKNSCTDPPTEPTEPMTTSKPKPADLNRRAAAVVAEATCEDREDEAHRRAVESGRRGGLKGGPARAAKLTPERRRVLAQIAVRTRWDRERARRAAEAG